MTAKHSPPATPQQQEAFYRGFHDHDRGVKRERCPYGFSDLIKSWRQGWDKAEKGMSIRLPEAG